MTVMKMVLSRYKFGFRFKHHEVGIEAFGDPSPRRLEISFTEPLHLWGTGRMVGSHQIDHFFSKPLPKLFAILAAADRWCTFEECLSVRDFVGKKMQVVRTGFNSYRQAF